MPSDLLDRVRQLSDFRPLIRAVSDEVIARTRPLNRRQAIVTAVGAGSPLIVTYKLHAADTNTYVARCLASYRNAAVGDIVWVDTIGGDSIVLGRQGGSVRGSYNAKEDFGAQGIGGDDTAALVAGISAAATTGRELYIPEGTYLANGALLAAAVYSYPIRVRGAGEFLTTIIHNASGQSLISAAGTRGTAQAITIATVAGATVLTIASTAGLAQGSLIIVRDTTQIVYGNSARTAAGVAGEIAMVKSVDSATQITLYGCLDYAYTTSGDVRAYNSGTVSLSLSDMSFVNPAPGTMAGGTRCISLTVCRNVDIHNVRFQDLDDDAMRFDSVVDFRVERIDCDMLRDIENPANNPYGLNLVNTCSNGTFTNGKQRYGRHLFTCGGGTATEPQPAYILVSHCRVTDTSQAGLDTHPGSRHITFDTCEVHNTGAYGFQLRGPDQAIRNCLVSGAPTGIFLPNGADRAVISDTRIYGTDVGVSIQGSDDVTLRAVVIDKPRQKGIDYTIPAAFAGAVTTFSMRDIDITGDPSVAGVNWGNLPAVVNARDVRIYDASIPWVGGSFLMTDPLGLGKIVTSIPAGYNDTGAVTTANRTVYTRVIGSGRISKIRVYVATSSGNMAVSVYANSGYGDSAVPAAQKATSGSVACPAAGSADIALGAAVTVKHGDWLAVAVDNLTATFLLEGAGHSTSATTFLGMRAAETIYPPPATASPGAIPGRSPLLIGVP